MNLQTLLMLGLWFAWKTCSPYD